MNARNSGPKFPGWLGPLLGPFVGMAAFYFPTRGAPEMEKIGTLTLLISGAIIGLVAGLIIWWMEMKSG